MYQCIECFDVNQNDLTTPNHVYRLKLINIMRHNNIATLSVAAWNVNGLISKTHSKVQDADFCNEIRKNDIICLMETHMGPESKIKLEGYHIESRHRKKCKTNNRYYGGMTLIMRECLRPSIKILKSNDSETIWVKLCKEDFELKEDIYIGFVYIVPRQSCHVDTYLEDRFQVVENQVQHYKSKGHVMLLGDFNARTAQQLDFIQNDSGKHLPGEDWYDVDYVNRGRVSKDLIYDRDQGQKLLDLCIGNQMRILNGRTLGDITGKMTCYRPMGASVVDYVVCQEPLLPLVNYCQIHDFKGDLSDHCMISCNLASPSIPQEQEGEIQKHRITKYKWSEVTREKFETQMRSPDFLVQTNTFLTEGNTDIDTMTSSVNSLIYNVLNKSVYMNMKRRKTPRKKKTIPPKKWFDDECTTLRRRVSYLSKLITKYPHDPHIRGSFFKTKKTYKSLLKRKRKEYKWSLIHQLENMSEANPALYWKILEDLRNNESKETDNSSPIPLDEWVQYFEKLNSIEHIQADHNHTHTNNNILHKIEALEKSQTFCELDFKITEKEIDGALKKLKNNKSPGIDGITGEMLKCGRQIWIPILGKLFNQIFVSKEYPKGWATCLLTPVYKKGDPYIKDNYRGISVNSVLAKLYNLILLERLEKYICQHKIMGKEQIGFRKKARTADHIFVIQTLFQKYCKGGKLYLCFVDFRKAYDYVWRNALMYKLLQYDIKGLLYYQIKAMYKEVNIAVKQAGHYATPFSSKIGVKQGDVLSPTLFNLYVNDLPSIFDETCDGATLSDQKLNCLLYADDLVLISRSRNGLQNCLNKLADYCQNWKMEVNLSKTKIMIMSKTGRLYADSLFLGDNQIENVKHYTYLGVALTSSGTFTKTKMEIKNKAMKALGRLKKLLWDTPITMSTAFKLFDQLIRPILTYGCEIWGPVNISGPGCREGEKQILEKIFDKLPQEKLNITFTKFLLGVSAKTSNIATMGETGRYPLYIYIINHLRNYYYRLQSAEENTLIQAAYKEQVTISRTQTNSWLNLTTSMLDYYNIRNNTSTQTRNTKKNKDIKNQLESKYKSYWKTVLTQSPKLDTYRNIKHDFYYEPYLDTIKDRQPKVALSRLRLSNHRLRIEQDRYVRPPIERAQRLCKVCESGEVEDEEHFLLKCAQLSGERKVLLDRVRPHIQTPTMQQLLQTYTPRTIEAVAQYIYTARDRRELILETKTRAYPLV